MTITLITVIMTALTAFFITTVSSASQQRSKQSAIQVADTAVDHVRGVGAAGALVGRDAGAVTRQLAGPLATDARVAPWIAGMATATGSGSTATLPTTPVPRQLGTTTFEVNYFVGYCYRAVSDTSAATPCTADKPSASAVQYLRNVIAVTWPDPRCTVQRCVYVTATLLNGSSEPLFNFNVNPPPKPVLTCVAQSSAIAEAHVTDGKPGRSILTNKDAGTRGCTTSGGIPAFTYSATGLPAGLTMAGDGTVSGAASGPAGDATVTITVRDGFLRTAGVSFVWTVFPKLVVTAPGNQAGQVGTAVTSVAGAATGGAGAPYTWVATGLPDGLAINTASGQVTGTPTKPGTSTVVLTATDSSGTRTQQSGFTWTITYPPLVLTSPGDQLTTRGGAVNLALQSSGGSGTVVWSDGGTLPVGLRIQGNRVVGTATSSVDRRAVTLTATDSAAGTSRTVSFAWTVDDGPLTATSPGDQRWTAGNRSASITLTATGGTAPYAWSDPGATLPRGVTLSGSGVVSGTPTTPGTYSVVLTVADPGSRTSQVSFTWTVFAPPTINSPGNLQYSANSAVGGRFSSTCSNGPCSYEVTSGSLPLQNGFTIDATGYISGTTVNAGAQNKGIRITVTDAAGATATTEAFQWTVSSPLTFGTFDSPRQVGRNSYSDVVDMTAYTGGGSGGYTYTYLGVTGGTAYYGGTSGDLSKIQVSSTGGRGSRVVLTMRVTDSSGATQDTTFTWITQ